MSDVINQSDAELSQHLKELQKKSLILRIIQGICLAGMIFSMIKSILPGVIAAMLGIIITGGIDAGNMKKVKESTGSGILIQALNKVFENVDYYHDEHLSYVDINDAGFNFHYDKLRGNDLISATYQGLNIKMSDIQLIDIDRDEDGHTHESTVFKGLWMICDFGKELSADVQVCEKTKLGQAIARDGIQTENEAFNKQFRIKSQNQEEAFYILTPHMMEYIVQMDERAKARTNLSFKRNGKLHIALNSGRDAFEVKGLQSDVSKIREQFIAEIRQVTDMIDELRISDSAFKN